MQEFPETRASLLVQLKDPQNAEAWEQFVRMYQPVIYRIARGRGLQDADARDLSQRVLVAIAAAIGRWESSGREGRFRHWLNRVVRNAIINVLTRTPPDSARGGSADAEFLIQQPEPNSIIESQIETEYRREVYLLAAEMVRENIQPDTWRAFELTTIEGREIAQVASQLGKPMGAIYTARSRVMHRLREAVRILEEGDS